MPVTFVYSTISSKGNPFNLAVTYIMAVKKDIGLKSKEIQRDLGITISLVHSWSWIVLSIRSKNQVARPFLEGYAPHYSGTLFNCKALERASIASVMFKAP